MSTGVRGTLLRSFLIATALLVAAWQAQAVQWTLTSAGPPVWTYTLTFDPLDNCNIFVSPSTITMTGLSGVVIAGTPTGSDFSGSLATNNQNWIGQVQNGGTKVVWTNATCGSGNFGVAKHVTGFTITAPVSSNGNVAFATTGMAKDTGVANSIDITGSVAGPAAAAAPAVFYPTPTASAATLTLLALVLIALGMWQVRRRMR